MYYTQKETYMYRKNLSWEYELVCLKLMHDEATSKDKEEVNRVPLVPILDQYKLDTIAKNDTSSREKEHLLVQVYKKLATFEPIAKEDHYKLRQRYIHQSSNLHTLKNAIANKPSTEGDNGIYGQRVVYGATGDKFPSKDFT